MNTKLISTLSAGAAAATVLVSMTAPAQAAAIKFGTDGIMFDRKTTVKFTFLGTNGANLSSLGIFQVSGFKNSAGQYDARSTISLVKTLFEKVKPADAMTVTAPGKFSTYNAGYSTNWRGTYEGGTITGPRTVYFTFAANTMYTLGLFNITRIKKDSAGNAVLDQTVANTYSTSSLNGRGPSQSDQRAVFGYGGVQGEILAAGEGQRLTTAGNFISANPFLKGGITIGLEDERGNGNSRDYNDFVINAEAVPEPLTMGGLALGGAWLAYNRRRRNTKNA
ncbi:MAG: PEP-CTERM sorting domain-containing protein [Oscillatoriaceae bacterium SKW80]|nr:PEP-CTERM sorting domain-containing protein [Oscillatoriaceae bacterium SKYG93]MCX8121145.1 PEP-CTERM sorting domain-containing protein [Oscillatoriaceae bacterium SKW80]MDW8453525.1 PEP-CTERM sorting domain-containing protein [Oscillatoriaceae cyanobacterium SKYGB_i_bin93]HIK26875.1 PEP-CTERM sorting domain-containing protein [Oscillatoriaceae cyanobacterium M7585_C2015_266]